MTFAKELVPGKTRSVRFPAMTTYPKLLREVRRVFSEGKARAFRAVEREKLRTAWEVGNLILEHVLFNQARAGYGALVVERLSKDLAVSQTELKYMIEFTRTFPIRPPAGELGWGVYRELLSVNDPDQRTALAARAEKGNWDRVRLRKAIRSLRRRGEISVRPSAAILRRPVLGPFYTYRIIKQESIQSLPHARMVDLGFSIKLAIALFPGCAWPAGTLVSASKNPGRGSAPFALAKTDAGEESLYTYKAFVREITDGDTLKVELDLGFGILRGETIRLRGVDCPEPGTRAGRRAKAFVVKELSRCGHVTLKSTRTRKEKWGRYLGDVFYGDGAGKYLNQILLDEGLAVEAGG